MGGQWLFIYRFRPDHFFVRWVLRGDLDFTSGGVMVSVGFVLGIISLLTGSKVLDPAYNKLRVDIYSVFVEASLTCKRTANPTLMPHALVALRRY